MTDAIFDVNNLSYFYIDFLNSGAYLNLVAELY